MSKKKDVIFTSPRGGKYEGGFKDGQRHGQGKLTYPDGRKFVGEWKDGNQLVKELTFMEKGNGKEICMKGNSRMGKNMVKEHTLSLLEESI